MKKPILIALVAELIIAYLLLAPACVLRHEYSSAWKAWHDNPTPETQAELDKQKRINTYWDLGFSTFFFVLIAGPTLYVGRMMNQRHLAAGPATP